MSNSRVIGICSESILLVVCGSEDVVANTLHRQYTSNTGETKMDREDGQVSTLQAVDKRQPDHITEGEHEPEAIVNDVYCGEDRRFHVQSIEDVESLEGGNEEDRVGDCAIQFVLVGDERKIEDDVADQPRTHFVECFDVNDLTSDQWERFWDCDSRIQLTADEEIVEHVATVTSFGKFAIARVGLARVRDRERAEVDVDRLNRCNEEVGHDDLVELVPDERPDHEVGPLKEGSNTQSSEDEQRGAEGIEFVLVSPSCCQNCSL